MDIIIRSKDYVNAVVSSGLIVTNAILSRLAIGEKNLTYIVNGDSEYLAELKAPSIKYVDVAKELNQIEKTCMDTRIPFFSHSISALNYLREC